MTLDELNAPLLLGLPGWYLTLAVYIGWLGVNLLGFVVGRRHEYLKELAAEASDAERRRLRRVHVFSVARACAISICAPLMLTGSITVRILLLPLLIPGTADRVRDFAVGFAGARLAERSGIAPEAVRADGLVPTPLDWALSIGFQLVMRGIPAVLLIASLRVV